MEAVCIYGIDIVAAVQPKFHLLEKINHNGRQHAKIGGQNKAKGFIRFGQDMEISALISGTQRHNSIRRFCRDLFCRVFTIARR
ncbi:MAG: hypothetical protein LUC27_00640 [Lachnospiraceae bacterium]|nr:hypothetical protein [Lachnospiraceae bacterium]